MTKRHEPSSYLPVPTEPPSIATRLRWDQQSRAKDYIALATEIAEQIAEIRQPAHDLMAAELGSRMPGVAVHDRLARPDRAQNLRRIVSRSNDVE